MATHALGKRSLEPTVITLWQTSAHRCALCITEHYGWVGILTPGTKATLPSYFPQPQQCQCHTVTYLACILHGLCNVVSSGSTTTSKASSSEEEMFMVEVVAQTQALTQRQCQ